MAHIVGYSAAGLRKNPDSVRLQAKLTQLLDLLQRLRYLFDGNFEHVLIWLKAPHPDLNGKTPLACLEEGRNDAVELLVYAMETGQPI